VAVGQNGTILTSPDGDAWDPIVPIVDSTLRDITWTGALFVAVGDGGSIVTSANGANWALSDSSTDAQLNAVAWSGERLVAAGAIGSANATDAVLVSSTDGLAWEEVTDLPPEGLPGLVDLAWGNDQFMAALDSGGFARSSDGIAWTAPDTNIEGASPTEDA